MAKDKIDINKGLKRLEEIAGWFDKGELDVEEGLKIVKEGFVLIKELKTKIEKIENEFKEIKESVND